MTTKVIIEHGTPNYNKNIEVFIVDDDGESSEHIKPITLKSGERTEIYVHSGHNIFIKEA